MRPRTRPNTSDNPNVEGATATPAPPRAKVPRPRFERGSIALWSQGMLIVSAIPIVSALLFCAWTIPRTTGDAYPAGDPALLELYTLHASQGFWGLGPYSRFGWHHPGPLFFYLCVPFYRLANEHALALNAAAYALNMTALASIMLCTVRYAGRTLGAAFLVAFTVFLWRVPTLTVSAWNPHVIVLPFAALILFAAVVATGRLSLLPALIGVASLLVQTHLGMLPCVLVAVLCAIVAGLWRRRLPQPGTPRGGPRAQRPHGPIYWFAISAAVGLVLWLPTIVEQLRADDGNLSKLTRFFLMPDTPYGGIPWGDALRVLTMMWTAPFRPGLVLPLGGGFQIDTSVVSIALVVGANVMLIVTGWWAAGRGHHVEAWTCRLCALMSATGLVAIARIRGGLFDHVVWWMTIVGVLSVAALASVAIVFAAERIFSQTEVVPDDRSRRTRSRTWVPVVAYIMFMVAVGQGSARLNRLREGVPRKDPAQGGGSPTEMAYRFTRGFIARAHAQRPLFHVAGTWAETAGIVLQFHKRGLPIRVEPSAVWLYGPMFAPRGDEDLDLTVANRDTRPAVEQQPDDCMLLERHGLSVHVRRSSLTRDIPVVCE